MMVCRTSEMAVPAALLWCGLGCNSLNSHGLIKMHCYMAVCSRQRSRSRLLPSAVASRPLETALSFTLASIPHPPPPSCPHPHHPFGGTACRAPAPGQDEGLGPARPGSLSLVPCQFYHFHMVGFIIMCPISLLTEVPPLPAAPDSCQPSIGTSPLTSITSPLPASRPLWPGSRPL